MQYADREVCERLNLGANGLKKIRLILRQMGLLQDRERVSDEKMPLFERIVEKQRQIGGTYENAINQVLEEQRRQRILSIFQQDDGSFGIDIFTQALGLHYGNADEICNTFLEGFITITDILRNIGDETSAAMLINVQEMIINNINFKFLFQQGRISD